MGAACSPLTGIFDRDDRGCPLRAAPTSRLFVAQRLHYLQPRRLARGEEGGEEQPTGNCFLIWKLGFWDLGWFDFAHHRFGISYSYLNAFTISIRVACRAGIIAAITPKSSPTAIAANNPASGNEYVTG